jgi:hypothetical protein
MAANEISTCLHCLALDQVDVAPKKPFQLVLQINDGRKILSGGRLEGDQEIGITVVGIKANAARCGAKNLEPRYAVAAGARHRAFMVSSRVILSGLPLQRLRRDHQDRRQSDHPVLSVA